MDIKDLKQNFYSVYLNEVMAEFSEHYAPLELMIEKFTATKKGMVLRSYLENSELLNKYIELLYHYDQKIKIDDSKLEEIIKTDEQWQEYLKKKLNLNSVYNPITQLPANEAMEYLRDAFSEKKLTLSISGHLLMKIDQEKFDSNLSELGKKIIQKISSHAGSPAHGEGLFYTVLAQLMIKNYLQSIAEASIKN